MVRLGGDTESVVCSAALDAEFHRLATEEEDTWSKWSLAECSRGGTMSVERQKAKPPRPEHRHITLKFGPNRGKAVANQHEAKSSIGGTNGKGKGCGKGKHRKGNTGSDEKFAVNLLTNSLGLSAEELAAYKKVHGDLRKFMADTRASSKTAASDLRIDKSKMSQFLCGTLPSKAITRRIISAVAEALAKGR
jgi:hypothetical protein